MDIEYLKRFVVIGQYLNFRKASEALFVSQPALSHSISSLEKEIGTPVFIRNTKNVSFTEAGNILFEAAQKILEDYEYALTEISKVTDTDANTLKIGYVGAALDNSLTPLLRTFREAEPDITVNLNRYHGTEIRETLESKTIQFAVTYQEYMEGLNGVRCEVIDREKFALLVNSSDPLASKPMVSADDLARIPLIICEKENAPYYYDSVMSIFENEGITPHIVQKVRLISDIYRLVDMGVGSAILSYSPSRQTYDSFALKFLPINIENQEILKHNKTLAWCGDLSPAGKKFVKTVKKFYNIG